MHLLLNRPIIKKIKKKRSGARTVEKEFLPERSSFRFWIARYTTTATAAVAVLMSSLLPTNQPIEFRIEKLNALSCPKGELHIYCMTLVVKVTILLRTY